MSLILDGTNGETFPSWTTATRPASPVVGQMGYNTTTGAFDAYTAAGWASATTNKTTGSVLKVQNYVDVGGSTTAAGPVTLNASSFNFTPVSSSSTLYFFMTGYAYMYPASGYPAGGGYGYYIITDSANVNITQTGYLWSYQYSSTYAQSIAAQANLLCSYSNTSTATKSFNVRGGCGYPVQTTFALLAIVITIMEVAN